MRRFFLWSAANKEYRWIYFLCIFWLGQNMQNDVHKKFCLLKFPKIREKFFFIIAGSGVRTKLKNEYIFELYITQAFFCPLSQNYSTTRSGDSCFVGHPNVHTSWSATAPMHLIIFWLILKRCKLLWFIKILILL